jgi:hypothetical protein
MDTEAKVLKVGDYITLSQIDEGELLGATLEARGVLQDEDTVHVSKPPSVQGNTVFQVCVRMRVSAAQELERYKEKLSRQNHRAKSFDEKAMEKEMLTTLTRVNRKEQTMNAKLFADEVGSPLEFGVVIQLKHVRSGKFLCCANQNLISISEPENFRVRLVDAASELAWFTVMPARAYQSMGGPILTGSKVLFAVTIAEDQFLHTSNKEFKHPNPLLDDAYSHFKEDGCSCREMNASLDSSEWDLSLFAEYSDSNSLISIGDLVYVSNPETKSYLRLAEGGSRLEFNKFKKLDDGEQIFHAAAYFIVEGSSVDNGPLRATEGGLVEWNEPLMLRHFDSGLYAKMVDGVLCVGPMHEAADVRLNELFSTDLAFVCVDNATTMRMSGFGLDATASNPSETVVTCLIDDDDDDAVVNEMPLRIHKESEGRRLELLLPLDARSVLLALSKDLGGGLGGGMKYEMDLSDIPRKVAAVAYLCQQLRQFICDGNFFSTVRQRLLREQGVLTCLVDVIELLRPLFDQWKEQEYLDKKMDGKENKEAHEALVELRNDCFTTLQRCFINCPENQLFVGDRFKVLLAYVHSGPAPMHCITTMLDNREIQEKKVTEGTIDMFIDLLREEDFSVTVLKLLAAFCSCQGQAMRKNQNLLGRKLLGAATAGQSGVVGSAEESTLSGNMFRRSTIGGEVLEKDASQLVTPRGLLVQIDHEYGADKIELSFPRVGETVTDDRMTVDELRVLARTNKGALYQRFLRYQVVLFAEMAYGRNYRTINKVRQLLRYDTIVHCIENTKLDPDLRSAFVRLATCVYIDCEPQLPRRWNNTTFHFNSIKIGAEHESRTLSREKSSVPGILVEVSPHSLEYRAIIRKLQKVIKEDLNLKKWSSAREELLLTLMHLINFNFYDECPQDLSAVMTVICDRLAQDWRGKHTHVLVRTMSVAPYDASASNRSRNGVIIPTDDDGGIETKQYVSCISRYAGALCDDGARKTMLRRLDDWRLMIFVISLVFVAVIVGFIAPPENPPIIYPAIDIICAW